MPRTLVYLGEINDEQQAGWRKMLSVFDEEQQEYSNFEFVSERPEIPAGHSRDKRIERLIVAA